LNRGEPRSILTSSEPYQAGNNQDNKSQNPSLDNYGDNPGNSGRPQVNLPDSVGNRFQLGLESTLHSLAPPPSALVHFLRTETSPLPTSTIKGSSQNGEPRNSFDRVEPTKLQPNDTSATSEALEGTHNSHALKDLGRKTRENEDLQRSSGVTITNPQRNRGVWYRIMRAFCCISDRNMTT